MNSSTANSPYRMPVVKIFDADGGIIKERLDVFIHTRSGEKLTANYDSASDVYILPDPGQEYFVVETEHPLYEPSGTYCNVQLDTIKLYLYKKNNPYYGDLFGKTYYTRYPDRLYIEFTQAPLSQPVLRLLDSIGLVGRYDSLFGENTYYRKDGKDFERFNCIQLEALRKSPLVKIACCVIREKSYMFYVPPHDQEMLHYADDVKQRKNVLPLTNKMELYYPSNLPQAVLDSITSHYGLVKSANQQGAEPLGYRNCTIYSTQESIGEGVLDIATTINRSGIINAIPKFEIIIKTDGFYIPKQPVQPTPVKKKRRKK